MTILIHEAVIGRFALLAVALIFLSGQHSAGQTRTDKEPQQSALSVDSLMKIQNVQEVQISPDGLHVLYTLAEADLEKNRYRFTIWKVACKGGEPLRLCDGPTDFSPRWSPDGKEVAFLSDRGGVDQIWIIPSSGGPASQLTDAAGRVTDFAWSPDGHAVAYRSEVNRDTTSDSFSYLVDRDIKETCLYQIDVRTKRSAALTPAGKHAGRFSWSPSGGQIACTLHRSGRLVDDHESDLYLIRITDGKLTPLVIRDGLDDLPKWSPDGKQIAFISQGRKAPWYGQTGLYIIPASGGEARMVSGSFDGSISPADPNSFEWSNDGSSIYFCAEHGASLQLFKLDLDSAKFRALTEGRQTHYGFTLSKDRRSMAFLVDRPDRPAEVWWSPTDRVQPQRLNSLNPHLGRHSFGEMEVVRWKSGDGHDVEGLLIKPVGYQKSRRYPLVTYIHGGPVGNFTWGFGAQPLPVLQAEFCQIQLFAGQGYAVFCPNVRGSDGYGCRFREASAGDWGGKDFQDLMTGIDMLVGQGIADEKRMGLIGHCYGGYLAAWAATRTKRFKAMSIGAGIFNLASVYGQTDSPDLFEAYFGGAPWQVEPLYRKCSPLFAVDKIETPILLQHGELDERIPMSQSKEFYTALRRLKLNAEFYIYPGQGHVVYEPRLQVELMRRNLAWFDRYLK